MKSKYTAEDLAFAYELYCEGFTWDDIADAFSGSSERIRKLVYHAMRHGIKKAP